MICLKLLDPRQDVISNANVTELEHEALMGHSIEGLAEVHDDKVTSAL